MRSERRSWLIFCLAFLSAMAWMLVLAGCGFFPGSGKGTISGTVRWPGNGTGMDTGLPYVAGVKAVATISSLEGVETRRVACDKEGVFVAGNLDPGSYTVRVEMEDCQPVLFDAVVEAGRETILSSDFLNCICLSPEPEKKPWTILYYMNGTDPAHGNVNKSTLRIIEKAIDISKINVVACHYDGSTSSTRLYSLKKPDYTIDPDPVDDMVLSARVLSPYYDFNSDVTETEPGLADTLESFVEFGKARYPADNYLVVISGHGTGIDIAYPEAADAYRTRSISPNISTHKEILIPELAGAIARANQDGKVKILATEACYMGMAEVAFELEGTGLEYFVTSECTVGNRLVTGTLIRDLCEESILTAGELAARIVGEYKGNSLAAVRMARIPEFRSRYEKFALAMDAHGVDDVMKGILAATFNTSFHGGTKADLFTSYYDLGHLAELVAGSGSISDGNLKEAAASLHEGFSVSDSSLIAALNHDAEEAANAHGLSTLVYLPDRIPSRYADYPRPIYRSLKIYRDGVTAWDSFLQKLAP